MTGTVLGRFIVPILLFRVEFTVAKVPHAFRDIGCAFLVDGVGQSLPQLGNPSTRLYTGGGRSPVAERTSTDTVIIIARAPAAREARVDYVRAGALLYVSEGHGDCAIPPRAALPKTSAKSTGAIQELSDSSCTRNTYLTRNAARLLTELGINSLDVATVRGPSRFLTRSLATWLYAQTDEHGHPLYSGIRYESRLGPHECWAIFDGTAVGLVDEFTVEVDSPALRAVTAVYGLAIR